MSRADTAAVKGALYDKGISLRAWCDEHGHSYTTTLNAIHRHAGGHAKTPWGQKTRAILRDLSKTTGLNLLPF